MTEVLHCLFVSSNPTPSTHQSFIALTSKCAISYGKVPPYSVVVPGSLPGKPLPDGTPGPSLACAVIVKRVDAQTRSKTAINELLRD